MKLKNLKNNVLGKECFYYNTIDSTQKEIWRRINSNTIKNGTLIIADIQTDGIGTHGRKWYTESSNNIAFSFYIECNCKIKKLDGLTIQIANIFQYIFEQFYNVKLNIKEPNDLYYNGKKIGGILENIASSIKNEFNIDVDREKIITEFCNRFEKAIIERIK